MSGNRWRAPVEDGGFLADPAPGEWRFLIEGNRRRFDRADLVLAGTDLKTWRFLARRLLALHLSRHGMGCHFDPERPLFLTGHQPELVHPGVWVKNIALAAAARALGVNALHLRTDNDAVQSVVIKVPRLANDPANVSLVDIPMDIQASEVPYESRSISDPATLAAVPQHVANLTRDWPFSPLLNQVWPGIVEHSSPLLGVRLADARAALEHHWGWGIPELPLSELCESPIFEIFAGHLLTEVARFRQVHNTCLHAHRRANRIRSKNHPVPDLMVDEDWHEAPFWIWSVHAPKRRRLFARIAPNGDQLDLRADREPVASLPLRRSMGTRLCWDWRELHATGWKVRPRALTTTLFARLLLADAFLHGIGGALYDVLTDELIRRFYGIEAPGYAVVSATRYLPLPLFPSRGPDYQRVRRESRDLRWNPQKLDPQSDLAREKERWQRETPHSTADRRARYRELRRLTGLLRETVPQEELVRCERRLAQCCQELSANAVLRRRDAAFVLYPASALRSLSDQVAESVSTPRR